jgi:hypothetical protein
MKAPGIKLLEAQSMMGLIFRVQPTDKYESTRFELSNVGNKTVVLNCLDTILLPEDKEYQEVYQRLFILGATRGNDVMRVMPGQNCLWDMTSACMDRRLQDPEIKVCYTVSKEVPSKELSTIGKRWRASRSGPGPQGLVEEPLEWKKAQDLVWELT